MLEAYLFVFCWRPDFWYQVFGLFRKSLKKKRQKELKGLKDLNFLLFMSLPSELKSQIEKLKTTEKLQKLILVENK